MEEQKARVARALYRALFRAGKQWIKAKEVSSEGPQEAASLLQDLAFRSVKANATQWTAPFKDGVKGMYEADKFLSHSVKVDGAYGSAHYHGMQGLRREFERATKPDEDLDDRVDYGFTVLRWLNQGNLYAKAILDNLSPRQKPRDGKFCIGDILWHKEYMWRGVVYGWGKSAEATADWRETHNEDDLCYHVICNDGKLRYAEEDTHVRVEGPLEFRGDAAADEVASGKKHLDMYFHTFSNSEGAYVPNIHLARRFPEERWRDLDRLADNDFYDTFPQDIPE